MDNTADPKSAAPFERVTTTLPAAATSAPASPTRMWLDRKSTRLNSSHRCISDRVFCLKKHEVKATDLGVPALPTVTVLAVALLVSPTEVVLGAPIFRVLFFF